MTIGIPPFQSKKDGVAQYWWGLLLDPASLARRLPLAGSILVLSLGITFWVSWVSHWEGRSVEEVQGKQVAEQVENSLRGIWALHQQRVNSVRGFCEESNAPVHRFIQSTVLDQDPGWLASGVVVFQRGARKPKLEDVWPESQRKAVLEGILDRSFLVVAERASMGGGRSSARFSRHLCPLPPALFLWRD